jgi:hypothetical protein
MLLAAASPADSQKSRPPTLQLAPSFFDYLSHFNNLQDRVATILDLL